MKICFICSFMSEETRTHLYNYNSSSLPYFWQFWAVFIYGFLHWPQCDYNKQLCLHQNISSVRVILPFEMYLALVKNWFAVCTKDWCTYFIHKIGQYNIVFPSSVPLMGFYFTILKKLRWLFIFSMQTYSVYEFFFESAKMFNGNSVLALYGCF